MFLTRSIGALALTAFACLPIPAFASPPAGGAAPKGRFGACFNATALASFGRRDFTEAAIDNCRSGDMLALPTNMRVRLNIGTWCDQETVEPDGPIVICVVRKGARREQGLPPLGHL